jgi:hypothetical protein
LDNFFVKFSFSGSFCRVVECPNDVPDLILDHRAVFFCKIGVVRHKRWSNGLFVSEESRGFPACVKQLNGNFCSPIVDSGGQPFETRYTIIIGDGILEW